MAGGDCGASPGDCFGTLNWAVGLYTAKYFPPSAKAKIEDLVAHLKPPTACGREHNDWMSPATKADALKKLDTYAIKVGYPDHPAIIRKRHHRRRSGCDVRSAAAADWAFM